MLKPNGLTLMYCVSTLSFRPLGHVHCTHFNEKSCNFKCVSLLTSRVERVKTKLSSREIFTLLVCQLRIKSSFVVQQIRLNNASSLPHRCARSQRNLYVFNNLAQHSTHTEAAPVTNTNSIVSKYKIFHLGTFN